MRSTWPALVRGTLVLALGAAGLIRGAVLQSSAAGTVQAQQPIVVTGAYVRAPLPPSDLAAAYFTVYNMTSRPDRPTDEQTGAGATAVLHIKTRAAR